MLRSTTLTTGVASCIVLLPAAACRPSADVAVDPGAEPLAGKPESCPPCAAAPKPKPGSPDDQDPPTILGARFVARDRVQLTFSEPLTSVEGVNPRQFRLSRAYSAIDGGGEQGYASGYYYDLSGSNAYDPPMVVIELELYDEQPEVLALLLNRPVPVELCDTLLQQKADVAIAASDPANQRRAQAGLFLHYTSRGSVGIRDKVNNSLDDVGADWALNFGSRHKQVYGAEPVMRLDLLPELACPDASMSTTGGPPGPT
jgi:hypothetical protein